MRSFTFKRFFDTNYLLSNPKNQIKNSKNLIENKLQVPNIFELISFE